MNLEIEMPQAAKVISAQFIDLVTRVEAARRLFDAGDPKEAYRTFPYDDVVGSNLEEYVNSIEE